MRDLPRLYYDPDHREHFTRRIKDPLLNDFWNGKFKSYDDRQRREAQGLILNRIGQFLAIPEIRSVVALNAQPADRDRQQLHRRRQSFERNDRPQPELDLWLTARFVDQGRAHVARGRRRR